MIGLFWMMMTQPLAITCSLGMLIGMLAWYHYCLRIYNSFKARQFVDARWQQPDEVEKRFKDLDRDLGTVPLDPAIASQLQQQLATLPSSSTSSDNGDSSISHSGFLSLLQRPRHPLGWQRLFCVARRLPKEVLNSLHLFILFYNLSNRYNYYFTKIKPPSSTSRAARCFARWLCLQL